MEWLIFSVLVLNYTVRIVAAFLPNKTEPQRAPRGPFRRPTTQTYTFGGLQGRDELLAQLEHVRQLKQKLRKKDKVDWAKEGF